jgi:anti-anti-sigma regulatory factor
MGDAAAKATDVAVVEIQDDPDPDQHNRVASAVQKQFTKSGKPVVLDFSGVPPSKLDFVLKSWLKR